MNKMNALDHLGPIADEMLAGLHADDALKRRVKAAAMEAAAPRKKPMRALAPALCCAALAIACVSALSLRLNAPQTAAGDGPVAIGAIAAGDGAAVSGVMVADLGDGAKVRAAAPGGESLFASGKGDMPMVTVDGAVYRMLATPKDMGRSLLGSEVGAVAAYTEEPSLASADEMRAGVSNVAAQGTAVYAVKNMNASTAVAAEVDGKLRLFQRVSYAGKGPGSASLEDTFDVRGQVKTLELSGVGTLSGEAANTVIGVLLDQATFKSADASARRQYLTATLNNGLKLQLGVSGDTLCGCGGWSCPEFFEAFEAAL